MDLGATHGVAPPSDRWLSPAEWVALNQRNGWLSKSGIISRDAKKGILQDYSKQKKLMKEALTVQSNVDHLISQKKEGQAQKQI